MTVSGADLLAVAARRAAMVGGEPPTKRMLGDWVDSGLLPKGAPRGIRRGDPWRYPDEAVNTVELIVDFRSYGASRISHLRICLWAFGQTFEFDDLQKDLTSEFRRLRRREERKAPWWDYDHRDKHRYSDADLRKAKQRLPKLDSRLAISGIQLPQDALLAICSRAYWGKDKSHSSISSVALSALNFPKGMPPAFVVALALIMSIEGAIGAPEETGLDLLAQITEDDLDVARMLMWLGYLALAAGPILLKFFGVTENNQWVTALTTGRAAFLQPDWIVANMALLSISHFNFRNSSYFKA